MVNRSVTLWDMAGPIDSDDPLVMMQAGRDTEARYNARIAAEELLEDRLLHVASFPGVEDAIAGAARERDHKMAENIAAFERSVAYAEERARGHIAEVRAKLGAAQEEVHRQFEVRQNTILYKAAREMAA